MEKIIQISFGGHDRLFCLTEDGRVYQWSPEEWNTIGGKGNWVELESNN